MHLPDTVATPFLPLAAVAVEAPDSDMAYERQQIEKQNRCAILRERLPNNSESEDQTLREERTASNSSTMNVQNTKQSKYVIPASEVPYPIGGNEQIFTVIGANVTKHYAIQKNYYVPAVEKLFFRLRSSMLLRF